MAKRLQIQLYNLNTSESISLPINPASVSLPNENNAQSYNIINYGEVVKIGDRRTKKANFTNLFPQDDSFLNILPTFFSNIIADIFSVVFSQKDTIDKINRWTTDKDIIRVIVSDYFNEIMQITRFEPVVAENTEDVTYNIDFVEYRDPQAQGNFLTEIQSNGLLPRDIIRAIPNSVVANKADDLYSLATKMTGDGANWKNIASKNGIIDSSKTIIGKVITL